MELREHARSFPFPEPVVAGRRAAEFFRDRVPLTTGPRPVHDAVEHQPVVIARSATFPWISSRWLWNQWLDYLPHFVGNTEKFALHVQ